MDSQGLPSPLLEAECREQANNWRECYAHIQRLYKARQPRESFESPMATFNSKLQQITEEITAVRGKLRVPRAKRDTADHRDRPDYETQKLIKQLSELDSQQRALFQDYNQIVQQEEEYAEGLERERQQGYAHVAQLEKIVANLRAKVPQARARSPPDALTTGASAANQASVSNSTGNVGHGEESSGMSDNANVPAAETPRRHGRRGSSIVVDTSSIRAHEERPKDVASERRERKRKHRVSQAASGDKVAKRRNTANARLLDVDRPFTATLASKWTEDPLISDDGTVDFCNLYHNGEVVSFCMVLEHPPESHRFYIFYCQEHDQFMKHVPLSGARRHLRRHNMDESETADVKVKMFGVRVLNCTQDLAQEYNDAIFPHFKGNTWSSRQKKKAAARGTSQSNGDDDAVYNAYSTPTRAPLRSLIPPARRSSRRCASSHTLGTRHWETMITNPKVGEIYCLTWHRDDRNYAVIVLPIGSFESVGIPGMSILGTNLLEEGRRKSHAIDPLTGGYIWSPGYEDGGKREDEREFPVIFFDNCLFPQNASYGWVMAADLQVFDSEDTSIPYLKTVAEFLKERKERGQANRLEDDVTRADSQAETAVDSTPSVPAVRDKNHLIPQIDAYFNASPCFESESDLNDDGYSTDESSHEPSDDEKDASTEPNTASRQDRHKPPVARMGTGTCEEDSWDLPGDTTVDGRANEPGQTRSSARQAAPARPASAHGQGSAEKQTPSSSSKDTSAAAAAAAESRPSCANTTTAIFTPKQPEALAPLTGGQQDVGPRSEGSSSRTHLRQSFGRICETWPGLELRPEARKPSSPTYTAQQRITIDHLMHAAGMPKAPLHTR